MNTIEAEEINIILMERYLSASLFIALCEALGKRTQWLILVSSGNLLDDLKFRFIALRAPFADVFMMLNDNSVNFSRPFFTVSSVI